MTLVLQTSDLLQAAVARLIAYVSDRGQSIGTICDERVYIRMAPDNVAKPYLVLTKAASQTDPEYFNLCKDIELDAHCVADDPQVVELFGDLVEQAFLTWRISSAVEGLLTCSDARRVTPEVDEAPELRDRHELTVTGLFSVWPAPLTAALTPNES